MAFMHTAIVIREPPFQSMSVGLFVSLLGVQLLLEFYFGQLSSPFIYVEDSNWWIVNVSRTFLPEVGKNCQHFLS